MLLNFWRKNILIIILVFKNYFFSKKIKKEISKKKFKLIFLSQILLPQTKKRSQNEKN